MGIFETILIWCNIHRTLITLLVALAFWGTAYGIYFRRIVVRFAGRGGAHSWKIDMTSKTAFRGGRIDANGGKRLM
jgi:hypothetical protein